MILSRRSTLLTTLAATLLMGGTAAHADIQREDISNFFNRLKTGQAAFSQLNNDGSQSSGMFYISRPGKMRFEYDGPKRTVLIASNGSLAVIEDQSRKSAVKVYPLRQTPLWLLLRRDADLTSDKYALDLRNTANAAVLTIQDPDKPQYGQIQLVFTSDPITLRQWVVTTPQGERTTVILGPIDTETELDRALFEIPKRPSNRDD